MSSYSLWAKIGKENYILSVTTLLMAVALTFMSYAFYRLYTTKLVTISPPRIEREFSVAGDHVSQSYLEQTATYLSDRLLSVSPASARQSFDSILPYLTTEPGMVKVIRDDLIRQAKAIEENDIYQIFYPLKVIISEKKGTIVVEGPLRRLVGNTYKPPEEIKRITFHFNVQNGRFLVTKIEAN